MASTLAFYSRFLLDVVNSQAGVLLRNKTDKLKQKASNTAYFLRKYTQFYRLVGVF